jgi:nitrogen fixation/metabolism regulation signal transduction histidine kinase
MNTPSTPPHQRSLRNYVLDPAFQAKYAGFMVGIALLFTGVLGTILWRVNDELVAQSRATSEQSRIAIEQARATVARGQDAVTQSEKVNEVVSSTIETCYADNPALLASFRSDASKDDVRLRHEQTRLETEAADLRARNERIVSASIATEQRFHEARVFVVSALAFLVLAIGAAGVVLTHRVAGPIHKMKRLFSVVGSGRLEVREQLRRGDELQHFFDAFQAMVGSLRERRCSDARHVNDAIAALESADAERALAALRALRSELADQLNGETSG